MRLKSYSKHYTHPWTTALRKGEPGFGGIAPYKCDDCGFIWNEPDRIFKRQGTQERGEWIAICPKCGQGNTTVEVNLKDTEHSFHGRRHVLSIL